MFLQKDPTSIVADRARVFGEHGPGEPIGESAGDEEHDDVKSSRALRLALMMAAAAAAIEDGRDGGTVDSGM